ncbi:MAG: TFIIB-type zinc ribbon-containing protein [Lachnospiraceae bacterium]|nr:TFIIB-type zinc ribbon-containing protein [Lachnospiraceae bacterium]
MSEFDTNLDAQTTATLEETDKKCPSCGGVMDFDPATGGLSCPYCGHTEEIPVEDTEAQSAEELALEEADKVENCDWGVSKKTVICKACGAESVYDALEISAVCPFCGSNQVMEASDQNTMAPGGVVPFQISDKQAADLFKGWIRRKWFCPKLAKESAKAKHFKGVYLPFWTFDAMTKSKYQGEFGRDKVKKKPNGETQVETTWHSVRGNHEEFFDDELICATTNHNQSMLQELEPYNTADNKAYRPEYVAGFAAERYAVGIKEAWQMAKESIKYKLKGSIEKRIIRENNADRVRNLQVDSVFSKLTYKYLLLPVWISSYKYKEKVYQFMVNGQTGKVSGKTPISIPKVIITIVAIIFIIVLVMAMSQ